MSSMNFDELHKESSWGCLKGKGKRLSSHTLTSLSARSLAAVTAAGSHRFYP